MSMPAWCWRLSWRGRVVDHLRHPLGLDEPTRRVSDSLRDAGEVHHGPPLVKRDRSRSSLCLLALEGAEAILETMGCLDHTWPTTDSPESTQSDGSAQTQLARALGDRLASAVTVATTEHFNLQTARAATTAEANGRASIYLAALSSNLIALAFIGQISRLGTAFYAFALILLPVLAFVGVVTFQRLVQLSIEDVAYAQRIARLRAFYLRLAPELEAFLLVVREPRTEAPLHDERLRPRTRQLTLTTAGMVAVVNSVLIGACTGLAVEVLPIRSFIIALAAGASAGAATLSSHRRHHRRATDAYTPQTIDRAAIFVSTPQQGEPG
jgi:hypothetical protein